MRTFTLMLVLIAAYVVSSQVPGEYTALTPDEYENNQEILNLMNFGGEHVTNQAMKDKTLPNTNFVVKTIYSVERQVVEGTNYRFDVDFTGCHGQWTVRANYVVFQSLTDSHEVTDSNIEITHNNVRHSVGCPGKSKYGGNSKKDGESGH